MNEKNLSPVINETRTGEDYNDLTLLPEVEIKYKPEVKPKDRPRVTMAMEAYKLIRPFFEGCLYHHEEAWVMLLNTSCVRCRKAQCRESRAYYYRPKNHLAIDDKNQCSQSNYIP